MFDFNSFNFDKVKTDSSLQINEINDKDIAIIGIAASLPMSDSLEGFWSNVRNNMDCIRPLPQNRIKDIEDYMSLTDKGTDRTSYPMGAYLDEIDKFDCRFFNISPRQAELMDPHHRIFLETVWHAVENAGYGITMLQGTDTGVFAGFNPRLEYKKLIVKVQPSALADSLVGNLPSALTGMVSYILDLNGPNLTVNTACSSSLVALHLACQAIRNKECSMAICGSIRLSLFPNEDFESADIGIISKSGQAKVFDDDADGTSGGEGSVVFLLKPLSSAVEDRDNIHAVIKGSSINNDGRAASVTAPNAPAQKKLVIKAWEAAEVNPETVTYIEAHGTGTQLGDPIEIEGLKQAFDCYTDRKQFCSVGSIKTNYGHLDTAAGLLGVLKAVMALKHREIPASINFNVPSRRIDFETTALYVSNRLSPWNTNGFPRRCGINSFGLSGTNAHVILEEAKETGRKAPEFPGQGILTLSAKTKGALEKLAKQYHTYLLTHEKVNLVDFCYTADTGRTHFNYRLAVLFDSKPDLEEKLGLFIQSGPRACGAKDVYYNELTEAAIEFEADKQKQYDGITADLQRSGKVLDKRLLSVLAQLYMEGCKVDFTVLFHKLEPYRISLPEYPFEPSRCWIETDSLRTDIPAQSVAGNINAYEETIRHIWEKALGYKTINITDNYFGLGGDSIQAIKIVNSINEVLGAELEAAELLTNPTVEKIAGLAFQRYQNGNAKIELAEAKEYYELSSTQTRFYIVSQLDRNTVRYNLTNAVILEGELDVEQLRTAFVRLTDRHEVLRSSFHFIGNKAVQKVHDRAELEFDYEDAGNVDINNIIYEFRRPFDLEQAPLMRIKAVRIDQKKHVLIYDIHHIVFDGASIGVFIRDLLGFYNNLPLPEMKIQYKDYAAWYNDRLSSDALKKQEAYWTDFLKGELPDSILPYTKQPPKKRLYTAGSLWFSISKEAADKLTGIANQSDTTLYVLLLSLFGILISGYSQGEDILIGSPVIGRNHKELENLIGAFINVLVMRLHVDSKSSFKEYLSGVKNVCIKALENQEYPYERLVEKLNLRNNLNPVFNVIFAFHSNLKEQSYELNDLKILEGEYTANAAAYDFSIDAVETPQGLTFNIVYSDELYDEETCTGFVSQFKNIVAQIMENENPGVGEIDLLSDADKKAFLKKYCEGRTEKLPEKTVVDMFFHSFHVCGSRIAVAAKDGTLTYGRLEEASDRLAGILTAHGVSNNCVVGIMLPRTTDLLIAFVSVLKSGGAYMPIDPTFPKERILYMLQDSNTGLVISCDRIINDFPLSAEYISMDKLYDYEISESCFQKKAPETDDLAYLLYTSGSTGRPKGVGISHGALYNFIHGISMEIELNQFKSILSLTTVSFDIFVLESILPLAKGLKIILADERQQRDLGLLNKLIAENEIDILQATPSRMNLLLSYGDCREAVNTIPVLLIGGENFPDGLLNKLQEAYGGRIFNMYGPTEATVWSSVKEMTAETAVSIGRPMLNTSFYILNDRLQLRPVGCPGELYIGGKGLARGYYNNEALTKEKFLQNPFAPQDRIYKTGDVAIILPSGDFRIKGRSDSQVKLNGYRIESGEIEGVLSQCRNIRDAAVKMWEADNGDYLCAYVTSEEIIDFSDIRAQLSKKLPYYMVPAYYMQLDMMAKTLNDKIDKKMLPKPEGAHQIPEGHRPAESELEKRITVILEEILGVKNIGMDANFFDLGGDSILLVQFQRRLQSEFRCELDIADFFNSSSLADIARLLEADAGASAKSRLKPVILPKDYISSDYHAQRSGSIAYKLKNDLIANIRKAAGRSDSTVQELLFCIYTILVRTIAAKEGGAIYTSCRRHNKVLLPEVDLEKVFFDGADLARTLESFKAVRSTSKQPVWDGAARADMKQDNEAIVGFFVRNECEVSYISVFDLVLEVSVTQAAIEISMEYAERLDRNKMKLFLSKYVKLLEIAAKELTGDETEAAVTNA